MTARDQLLEPLVRSPDLPDLVRRLNGILNEESARRRRFREEMDDSVKAEFVNGEVIMQSPASARHILCVGRLVELLRIYRRATKGGQVFSEISMIGLARNDYEPDVVFYLEPKAALITGDTNIFPAPDFIAEVLSKSTATRDRGIKFEDYARAGVPEYWIIDAREENVEQYVQKDGEYTLAAKLGDGVLHSPALPDFHVPAAALFDDAAHDAFIASLPFGG